MGWTRVKICKECKRFDGKFVPPPELELPTLGICNYHGRTSYTCETDVCLFHRYYWKLIKNKVGQGLRTLRHNWGHFIYFLRRSIYYKVEKLWIRPQLCVVCGKRLGKYYYGAHKFPVEGKGKHYRVKGTTHTVQWIGKTQKIPHWECEICFHRVNSGEIITETAAGYGVVGV